MNVPLFVLGLLIALFTAADVLFVMVLPRRPFGIDRVTLWINKLVLRSFSLLARLPRTYEGKDAVLAPMAPFALVLQLLSWAAGLTLGFGLMIAAANDLSLGDGLLQAMTALFTVGAAHAGGPTNEGADIAVGAIWVVIVALQIAYLPTLYGAFSRREALVTLLESRAGLPSWGPEVLARHQLVGIIDTLPELYSRWEEWAADVAESHTTYPVLLLFRSPEAWYSWITGLLAVLDAAAIHLSVAPTSASSQARLCLRMGFTLFDRIALLLDWDVDPDPNPEGPIQLTYEEYAEAVELLGKVRFPLERTAEESWADFRGWRVNYETTAYRLADRLTAPYAPWSGDRRLLTTGPVSPRRPPQRSPKEPEGESFDQTGQVVGTAGRLGRRRVRTVPKGAAASAPEPDGGGVREP